jgi:hypothetical protein
MRHSAAYGRCQTAAHPALIPQTQKQLALASIRLVLHVPSHSTDCLLHRIGNRWLRPRQSSGANFLALLAINIANFDAHPEPIQFPAYLLVLYRKIPLQHLSDFRNESGTTRAGAADSVKRLLMAGGILIATKVESETDAVEELIQLGSGVTVQLTSELFSGRVEPLGFWVLSCLLPPLAFLCVGQQFCVEFFHLGSPRP